MRVTCCGGRRSCRSAMRALAKGKLLWLQPMLFNPPAAELNPDTATVQLWKQHQFILLMPSSPQYLLMKAELVCLAICWAIALHWPWKTSFSPSSICLATPRTKPCLVREAMSLFSYNIQRIQGKFHQNLLIFPPLPQNTRSNRNCGVSSRPLSSHCL